MGYGTEFRGELKFTSELSTSQLTYLNTILGGDCREHPEWNEPELRYIDLELTEDLSGIEWNGGEKTYHMTESINLVIRLMRSRWWPAFSLTGELLAQGEEIDDRWMLVIKDGVAATRYVIVTGQVVTCPECNHKLALEEGGKR